MSTVGDPNAVPILFEAARKQRHTKANAEMKDNVLECSSVHELVEERHITIHYVKGHQLVNLGTKHLSKHGLRYLSEHSLGERDTCVSLANN